MGEFQSLLLILSEWDVPEQTPRGNSPGINPALLFCPVEKMQSAEDKTHVPAA